jgi:hypothetical protein
MPDLKRSLQALRQMLSSGALVPDEPQLLALIGSWHATVALPDPYCNDADVCKAFNAVVLCLQQLCRSDKGDLMHF